MIVGITGILNAGKSTVAKILANIGYIPVMEYTTRPVRKGEVNHVDYHFINDDEFDRMEAAEKFAETLHVATMFGLWKYGAKKEDLEKFADPELSEKHLLVCGPHQMEQMLDTGIPMISVLLDIDRQTALDRAAARGSQGDDVAEFERRFNADKGTADRLKNRVSMVIDATALPDKIAEMIYNKCALEDRINNTYRLNNENIVTSQPMNDSELHMYLEGDRGLAPYLRMKDRGMPQDSVNQIAWLLLNGGSCGFCKVCREKPCGIKDGEKCTTNIANYIRECVHAEDTERVYEDYLTIDGEIQSLYDVYKALNTDLDDAYDKAKQSVCHKYDNTVTYGNYLIVKTKCSNAYSWYLSIGVNPDEAYHKAHYDIREEYMGKKNQ